MSTKSSPRDFSDEAMRMGVVSHQYHHRDTVVHDPFAEYILPLGVEQSPSAPIPGFVPRMSNLKAMPLETLRDHYDVLDHALTAGEISEALQAEGLGELQFVHDAGKTGKPQRIQSIPVIGWVLHPVSKRFCNYPDDIKVGIELPMSDYHWTGLNTLGKRMVLFVEKISVVGNQHHKSVRLHLAHFSTTHVATNQRHAAWSVYYHANQPCNGKAMMVDVFEFNRYGGGNVLLGKVPVLSNATPKYLVNHRTGNVYQLLKAETYLKVIHIGYVPPAVVEEIKGVSHYYNLPE